VGVERGTIQAGEERMPLGEVEGGIEAGDVLGPAVAGERTTR